MHVLQGIPNAVPGERVLVTVPPLAPYVTPSAAAGLGGEATLRRRLNLFAQRALTHVALTDEQRSRIADAMLLGRSVAPGIVDGLEVAIEGAGDETALVLMPGHAIAPDGNDIELGYPMRIPYRHLPVFAPQVDALLRQVTEADPARNYDRLSALEKLVSIDRLAGPELRQLDLLPHAMVLVAMPRTVAIDRTGELDTPCPNATDESAFSLLAWEDGFLLAWVPWPRDASLPPWASDGGTTVDARFRNRLAYAIFNNERERAAPAALRSMRLWTERSRLSDSEKAALAQAELEQRARARVWPWETLGVPLALVGFDADHHPAFADRGAVVRQGGGGRNRSGLVLRAGDDVLWQARVSQLIEHLAEIAPERRNAGELALQFDWLPPAGVLPKEAADLLVGRQFIFPSNFDVQVQPVPIDTVDALIAESAPLLPLNLSLRDQVQILVPVAPRYYEPDLLKLDEKIHPLFDREVARLAQSRADLLLQRDVLRRRYDVLNKAVTGELPQYPQDDPNALQDETGALAAASFARVHVSAVAASAIEKHGFFNTASRLALQATDVLFVFVRADTAPPAIRVEIDAAGATVLPLVWGATPAAGSAQHMGALPESGVWTRLEIPLAALNMQSATLTGMRFGMAAGTPNARVTWGYAGKLSNGFETYWLTDAIPAGAVTQDPASATDPAKKIGEWSWEPQGTPLPGLDDAGIGLPVTGKPRPNVPQPQDVREIAEIDSLVASYLRSPGGLVGEMGVPWPAVDRNGAKLDASGNVIPAGATTPQHVAPSDQPALIEQGFDAFIARMSARIAAANDHVEFGFLRARTDIFRVRQSILGTDKAGQLLTSPSASELIQRSTSIAATEKDFDDYFNRANTSAITPPTPPTPSVPRAAAPSGVAARAAARGAFSAASALRPAISRAGLAGSSAAFLSGAATSVRPGGTLLSGIGAAASPGTGSLAAGRVESAVLSAGTGDTFKEAAVSGTGRVGAAIALPPVKTGPTVNEVVGSSIYATTFNTVTVGKRLEGSAAVETKNAAATGKTGFVTNSLGLLHSSGISLAGIDVYGFKDKDIAGDPDSTKAISAVSAFDLFKSGRLLDFDALDPAATDQHEAGYFKRGLEAIDSMVRFLRGVELRAEDYRRLQSDAAAARGRIVTSLQAIQTLLDNLAARLGEVRHDLSVARALRAEEQARIDALIAKRMAILTEHVQYLVFRRPRVTNALVDTPVLQAQPAIVDDPVPRCRDEHPDLPPELQAMVDALKDVPARWFRGTLPIFTAIDRVDLLERVVEVARERLVAQPAVRQLALIEGADTKTGIAIGKALDRHRERITVQQQSAFGALANFSATSVKQAIAPLRAITSVGDLMRAAPPARNPTLSAAGLLDDIAGVAGCLYTAFGQVPPSTRLVWAERFSELDPSVSLRALVVLPGFGDETAGVDFLAWRGMQGMVDWLFNSIEDDAEAIDAINDLVRVCLLLAAHAPVKRIIGAQVQRPVLPQIDKPIPLSVDPRVARIGMQVLVHSPATQTLIARAVIDDIAVEGARARITQVLASNVTIDASSRVQLQSGPPLSTPAKQAADAKKAVSADTTHKASSSGIGSQAERRIGKQVEVLAGFRAR